jgi:hypothetical protein
MKAERKAQQDARPATIHLETVAEHPQQTVPAGKQVADIR